MAVSRDDKVSLRLWERAKEVFEAAVDLHSHDRESYLQNACVGDSALLAEVKDLLDFHDRASSFLQDSAKDHTAAPSILPVFAPGQIVAHRFRIMRLIGAGGMGEVYVAYDLELGELVALKTLQAMLSADARMVTSFRQEVHLARQVTHPNVCRIFDMFWHQDGDQNAIAILTMEYLPGQTLLDLVHSEGPLLPSEALPLIQQIAEGLDAAHKFGIIHGDFKSSNVMLVPQVDGSTRAIITDFGLASDQHTVPAELRDERDIVGTPAYIAPEQLRTAPVTPAADIYAFGVVLFEMLTGQLPFQGGPETLISVKRKQHEPPSLEHANQLDPFLQSAILKCIDPEPANRPRSAADVFALLSPKVLWTRPRKLFLGIAASLALAVGVGLTLYQPNVINPEAQAAVDRARVALENQSVEGFATAIEEYKRATTADPKWAVPWAELAYAYAASSNARLKDGKTALPLSREAALHAIQLDPTLGKAYGALGWAQSLDFDEWPKAEDSFRKALDLTPSDGETHYWFGVHLRKKGRFKEAEEQDRLALKLVHQRDPNIWSELAFLFWTSGQIQKYHQHIAEQMKVYPNFALTRYLYARLLKLEKKYDRAADELSFAEKLEMNPITVLVERASLEEYRGNISQAREDVRQLEKMSQTQEIDGLLLAGVYADLGDFDTAFATLERAYRRQDNTLLSLATSPTLQPLHGDPRYRALLGKLHFSDQIMQQMEFKSSSLRGESRHPN